MNDLPPVSSEMLERAIGDEAGSPALIRSTTRRGIIAMLVASSAIPVPRENALAGGSGKALAAGGPRPARKGREPETQQLMTYSDLVKLGWDWKWIGEGFKKEFGRTPTFIYMNSEKSAQTSGREQSVDGAPEKYKLLCYKSLGRINYTSTMIAIPTSRVVASQWVRNEGNEEATGTLTISGSYTNSVSVSTSTKYGVKLSGKGKILGLEIGLEGSYEYSTTGTSTSTEAYTLTSSVQVKVPPRSKRRVQLVAYFQKGSYTFQQPIRVTGYVGADFRPAVRDDNFWFMNIQDCLITTSNWKKHQLGDLISGEITTDVAMDSEAIIGEALPL